MDKSCFVIQPFCDPYNKRYDDVFEKAIINAGLKPYRVDKDPAVSIPIKEIESGIKKAAICFADITLDNPNVWFELGYALAIGKDVCLVCSTNERTHKYPFDIQHRTIISYTSESSSDFDTLRQKITDKLTALLKADRELAELPTLETGIKASDEMQPHEQAVLISIVKDYYDNDSKSGYLLKEDLAKAGFNELATSLAIMSLLNKEMLAREEMADRNGYEYVSYRLTPNSLAWINENKNRLELKCPNQDYYPEDDEIPF